MLLGVVTISGNQSRKTYLLYSIKQRIEQYTLYSFVGKSSKFLVITMIVQALSRDFHYSKSWSIKNNPKMIIEIQGHQVYIIA